MNDILQFNDHKVFTNEDNNSYVFLSHNNSIYQIDDKTKALINLEGKNVNDAYEMLNTEFTRKEFNNLIETMIEKRFILNDISKNNNNIVERENIKKIDAGDLKSLTLMIIQQCNLHCKYCYGDGGEFKNSGKMEVETAIKAIDFITESSETDKLLITFFGGEPLMNFNLIQEVVEYCLYIESKTNKKFNYSITTNGILLNEEIERFLIDNNFSVQVSLDGNKKVNDSNRYFSNGIGSYDFIVDKTKNLRENHKISVRATVSPSNLDLISIFEHLYSLKFSSIAIVPAHNLFKKDDYNILIKETKKLNSYLLKLIQSGEIRKAFKMRIQWDFLQRIHQSGNRTFACGVGRNLLAVDIEGVFFPCQRFVSEENYNLGNVFDGVKNQNLFLNQINVNNFDKCTRCWIKNLCVGGCPNESYNMKGEIGQYSKEYCAWNRENFEDLINLYLQIDDNTKKNILSC